jgi:hypothetical protein
VIRRDGHINVVNIDQKEHLYAATMKNEQRCVNFRCMQIKLNQFVAQMRVLGFGGLFKSIKCFTKFAHIARMICTRIECCFI